MDDIINTEKEVISKAISGNWLISEYIESAQLLDLNPLPENYNDHMDEDTAAFINSNIVFNENTVVKYSPHDEIGFIYENEHDLFFGYKIPLDLEMPIIYVCIDHLDFNAPISFIQDAANNAYLEINYHYYKLKKISD